MDFNYTFVIPHHNNPILLNRCLLSIPKRPDVQIIVVDDNSDEDKKASIVENDNIKLLCISKTESKGAGRARNYGVKEASGKWILFPDCDDFYAPNFLEKLDVFLDSGNDIVYFNIFDGYDEEKKQCVKIDKGSAVLRKYAQNRDDKVYEKNVKHLRNACWDMMIKKEFVDSHGLKFEEVKKGNDALFKHGAAIYARDIDVILDKIYYWVLNKNSLTHKKWSKKEMLENLEHQRVVNGLRIKDGAWATILPYSQGLRGALKQYGLFFFVRFSLKKLLLLPWPLIWGHKLFFYCCEKLKREKRI